MDKKVEPLQELREKQLELPSVGEIVVVRCRDFRCLAYRDHDGKWRATHADEELLDVLEIIMRF